MPMTFPPESNMGKEIARWNKPYVFEPFPKMLYKASKRPDGVYSVGESEDSVFGGRDRAAEEFTKRCQRIVKNEREEQAALEQGWRATQGEAMELLKVKEEYISTAAAHRLYEDRNLGEKAQREAAEADAATPEHLPAIPEKKRRGRPRKVAQPTA